MLKTAQTISSEETMLLLSSVRMGINLGLIDDLSIATVNELFIQTQPAFLQKLRGSELGVEERNVARASYLRSRLSNGRQAPGIESLFREGGYRLVGWVKPTGFRGFHRWVSPTLQRSDPPSGTDSEESVAREQPGRGTGPSPRRPG